MRRFRSILVGGAIAVLAGGCGEDQPNTSTPPEQVNEDFAKKTADMMKAANTGMDKKNLKSASKGTPTATPETPAEPKAE
ncbi:hypothetical protein [Paludisphaera soli]|uniref:hypothetical protein n=1 Tax=Paludisphaera soli TaxID=2712865 RepID=UPI0013EC6C51|nr:hypothetical protein [Paludisphaera soli]